jgi:hypothetical protein
MTSDTKYRLGEYLKYLDMDSATRHVLVEGRDDRRALSILFVHLLRRSDRVSISIDIAERLIELAGENRKIVEHVSAMIEHVEYSHRFVGFSDREFRGFDWAPQLHDHIQEHRVNNRLVWSRGHSIENYFLEVDTLREALIEACPDGFWIVSAEYNELFDSLICMACAIGLAAKDINRLNRIRPTIHPSILMIEEHNLEIDFDTWETDLVRNLSEDKIECLFERYRHWNTLIKDAEIDLLRWMCDGHIAHRLVWATYEKCLTRENCRLAPAPHTDLRFNMCAAAWARRAALGQCTYPAEILELLGFLEDL